VKSQQSLKFRLLDYVFLRFLNAASNKRKKSRFFLDFQKKRKKRILDIGTKINDLA